MDFGAKVAQTEIPALHFTDKLFILSLSFLIYNKGMIIYKNIWSNVSASSKVGVGRKQV